MSSGILFSYLLNELFPDVSFNDNIYMSLDLGKLRTFVEYTHDCYWLYDLYFGQNCHVLHLHVWF